MKATFVSVWDFGIEVKSDCEYDPESKTVSDIELVHVDGLDMCITEYILLPDGTELNCEENNIIILS